MKVAWLILLISAFTDFIIASATGVTAAMVESASGELPSTATLLLATLGGLVAAARTVQQALKASPANTAALKGEADPIVIPATVDTPAVVRSVEKSDTPQPEKGPAR